MLIFVGGRQQRTFYLPGDMQCMPWYYACKFEMDIKPIRDMLQNLGNNLQLFTDQLRNQLIGMAAATTTNNMSEILKELSGSIEETVKEIEKKYPRDPNLFIRPIKAMRAAGLNRKVIPVIYHHIRSNC